MALWRVYGSEGMAEKALAAANTVPSTSGLARDARFAVAISLIQLKRFDGAAQALTALYATGHAAAISNALGVIEIRRPAVAPVPHSAAEYFRRATEEDPDNTDYLFNLGYAYALAGDQTNALTSLRETVRFDATNGDAHFVMSAVLGASGRSAEAQRELELARQLGTSANAGPPGTRVPAGLERLATTLDVAALSRLNAAIADPAERDQEATAAFHLGRARTLVAAGNDREAISELRRAIYLQPYADEPHLLLGRAYLRAGRTSDAVDEFKVALWCHETAAGHVALGQALLAEGDREAARKESARALAMAPDSSDARDLSKRIGG
jgi:tetratricopeptide (TPR) repeat protein